MYAWAGEICRAVVECKRNHRAEGSKATLVYRMRLERKISLTPTLAVYIIFYTYWGADNIQETGVK